MVAALVPRSFRILEWKLLSLVPEDDGRSRRKRHPISGMTQEIARLLRPVLRGNPTANVFVEQQSAHARNDMHKLAYATLGVCSGLCDSDAQTASFISASSKSSMIQPHLPDLLPKHWENWSTLCGYYAGTQHRHITHQYTMFE